MREKVIEWLSKSNYMEELKEYIRLPSRSNNKEEVEICAEFSQKLMRSCGLDVSLIDTIGNKLIYGESIAKNAVPSILIYGHYDVQPEGDHDLWDTPPFKPSVRGDKLYGRGTADNKGQHFAHILALRYLREFHKEVFDKINIKFMLDGDEELGSYSLPEVIKQNSDMFSADFIYVSDGPSLSTDKPSIVCSVRGILDFQIIVKHNQSDLHSGNFGGVARSATLDLVKILDSMLNENAEVLIDGFYDNVINASDKEIDALNKMDNLYTALIAEYKLTPAVNYKNRDNKQLNQLYPTLNINGLRAGGVGNKRRTIIPSEATASIDCRMVPDMNPERLIELINMHVKTKSKEMGIEDAVTIEFGHYMDPIKTSIDSEYIELVRSATKIGFGVEPMIVPRLGGSLPIYLFPKYLDRPVVLVPLSHPDSRNHAPNENLDIPYFESGVVTMVALLLKMSDSLQN